jgi:D-tyrosyl-tRNA(Tyr) deacylase
MRVVIQRVKEASVLVNNKEISSIKQGLLVLVGFTTGDSLHDIEYFVKKIINLRIFNDNHGIMNLSVQDINGEVLSVSQFTLYADTKKGNRPSYEKALNREEAIKLYDLFNTELEKFVPLKKGMFGEDMKVSLINDGPVTIIMGDDKDV